MLVHPLQRSQARIIKFWYHIWDHKGNPLKSHAVSSIDVPRGTYLDELARRVWRHESISCLEYVIDGCLLRFAANALAFRQQAWLNNPIKARSLITSEADPLIVWLPDPLTIPFYHETMLKVVQFDADYLASEFSKYYEIPHTSDEVTIHDVLRARCGTPDRQWSFKIANDETLFAFRFYPQRSRARARRRGQITYKELPDVLDEQEWKIVETVALILISAETDPEASTQITEELISSLDGLRHRLYDHSCLSDSSTR